MMEARIVIDDPTGFFELPDAWGIGYEELGIRVEVTGQNPCAWLELVERIGEMIATCPVETGTDVPAMCTGLAQLFGTIADTWVELLTDPDLNAADRADHEYALRKEGA